MQKSDSINELAAALVIAQPAFETAKMDSVNPFFKSKYADLGAVWDAVREALRENGLTVSQFPDAIGSEPALTTILIHASGQWISGTYPLIVADKDHTAQGFGSAISYARRYGLSAVLGVIADTDDDGNAASKHPKPAAAPSKQPGGELYAPEHVQVSRTTATNQAQLPPTDRVAAAKSWALGEIPRIKTMDKATLDKFSDRFAKTLAELKTLDTKTSVEIEKAIGDRYTALFD